MRCKFISPENGREAAEGSAITQRIDSWWREFQAKADEITALFVRKSEWDLPEWMDQHLQANHPDMRWEDGHAAGPRACS